MKEEWRPVVENPDYEVSNLGRVRSWRKGNGHGRADEPKILGGTITPKGYVVVELGRKRPGERHNRRWVHRLVLEAFVGPRPEGTESRHKNGTPNDNTVANLEWSTHVDNMRDQFGHGTRIIGERHPRTKLTDEQVREIHAAANAGKHGIGRQLAEKYGIKTATVTQIKKMQTRKAAL